MNVLPAVELPTKIKEEECDDACNIIDLDLDKSPRDYVDEWNSKVQLKFKNAVIIDSEQNLDILMKWYIQTLKEEAINFEDIQTLTKVIKKHLQFFKLHFDDLNTCFVDNYLTNMEEILSFDVNLEVKCLPDKQENGNSRAYKRTLTSFYRKLITVLNVYLLSREDHMCHVIMKVKLNIQSAKKELLNIMYRNFLTKRPKEKSDLEFCRAYILYQKWKTIRKSEEWENMDKIMYTLHERTPNSIKSNPVLRQILLPKNDSILGTLAHISENHLIISEEYFKYIKSNKIQDESVMTLALGDLEIQDDDMIPDLFDDGEGPEFADAYKDFLKSLSPKYLESEKEPVNIKEEEASEDDDCQIVGVSFAENINLIHEILDDSDDDDMQIVYATKDIQKSPQEEKVSSSTNNQSPIVVAPINTVVRPTSPKIVEVASPEVSIQDIPNEEEVPVHSSPNEENSPNLTTENTTQDTISKTTKVSIETQTDDYEIEEAEPCPKISTNVTSAPSPEEAANLDLNASPDVTSTSAEVQDFNEREVQVETIHFNADISEIGNTEEYYTEGCMEHSVCSNHESVTQSNIQYIENEKDLLNPETSFVMTVETIVDVYNEDSSEDYCLSNFISNADQVTTKEKVNQPLNELEVSLEKSNASENVDPLEMTCVAEEKLLNPSVNGSSDLSEVEVRSNFGLYFMENNGSLSEVMPTHEEASIVEGNGAFIVHNDGAVSTAVDEFIASTVIDVAPTVVDDNLVSPIVSDNIESPEVSENIASTIAEENIPSTSTVSPETSVYSPPTENKVPFVLVPRAIESLQNTDQSLGASKYSDTPVSKKSHGKRVQIGSIKDSKHSVPRVSKEGTVGIRGILKNARQANVTQIPWSIMNENSLRAHNVKPDNVLLQSKPIVLIKRISENDIFKWLRMSEVSRKIKRDRKQLQLASMMSIKVDYHKQTSPYINKNDMVQYSSNGGTVVKMSLPETFGQWRSNSLPQTHSSRLDEGLQELPYTEKKTGKRKRQNSLTMYNTQAAKRGPVFRKTPEKYLKSIDVNKTTRKRKKSEGL